MEDAWRMGPKGKGGGKGVPGVFGKGKSSNSKSSSSKKSQPMSEDAQLKQMQRIQTLKAWCRSAQTKIKCTLFEKKKLPKKVKTSVNKLLLKINETEQNLCDGGDNPKRDCKADSITNACSVLADLRTLMKECDISE